MEQYLAYAAANKLYDDVEYYSRKAGKYGRLGQYLPKQNMPKRQRQDSEQTAMHRGNYSHTSSNIINQLSTRVVKKLTGRGNVDSIVGRNQYVHVSRGLRDKIQKVIHQSAIWGAYYTTRQHSIAIKADTAGTVQDTGTQGGYSSQIRAIQPGRSSIKGDTRWWLSHGYTDQGFVDGDDFQYFTPLKFLDAASVLWNQKAMSKDYGVQGDNFTHAINTTSGAPNEGSASAPKARGVDIHVKNSYVTWELKNQSQRALIIEFYHCVPKVTHPDQMPLEAFSEGLINAGVGSGELATILTTGGQVANLTDNPSLEPKHIPAFGSMYKYEKISIHIGPGETCMHSIQGPKGLDISYSKLFNGLQDEGGKMWSKSSLAVMLCIKPDLVHATAGVTLAGASGSGRFVNPDYGADLKDVVCVEVKEVFKLQMPDDTGFITANGVAGTKQTLNFRQKVRAYANFTASMVSDTPVVYAGHNEENTAANIAATNTY